ncbi:MAG: cellulase family glycosylhydrolase [Candidatus Dormiibacterota bacterium]
MATHFSLPRSRVRTRCAAGLVTLGLIALAATQAIVVGVAAAPLAIHVSGNHLVNGAGDAVTLHGANISGTEFACDQGGGPTNRGWSIYGGQPLGQLSTYQDMTAWNMNVVRVPLNEDCWQDINGVNPAYAGSNYQSAIATEVNLINQAGMIAILDLHWTSPGAYAAVAQQPMADADHSVTFWQSVATYFKSDPAVIFELFNEPFFYGSYFTNPSQNAWECWLDGCSLNQFISGDQIGPDGSTTGYTTSYTWNTAGMQTLINAIRGTGAAQPIQVNGLDWANDDSGWLQYAPTDPDGQLIAGAHDYPEESCDTTSCWNSQQAPISASHPFIVSETGDNTTSAVSFLPTFLAYADSHGWSYLAWTWNPWTYSSNVLITDWNGDPTAGEGAYFKAHLLSLGGTPLPSGTPTPTHTATPTPAASHTPTPSPTADPTSTPTPSSAGASPTLRPSHRHPHGSQGGGQHKAGTAGGVVPVAEQSTGAPLPGAAPAILISLLVVLSILGIGLGYPALRRRF